MLHSERKRLKELEEREARGDSVWTTEVPAPLRLKLKRLINSYWWVANQYNADYGVQELLKVASTILAEETGTPRRDILAYLDTCVDEQIPDLLEATALAVKYWANDGVKAPAAVQSFHDKVNKLLESYRISYSLENCEVVEFESRELHREITQRALRLLTEPGWERVEEAYQDGLKELANGKPGDAITDATTALQEAFRKVGCEGEDFTALLRAAKKGILKGFDEKYIDAISKLVEWTSAARSKRGDSHKVVAIGKEDAWFVMHTVGILILRLSQMPQSNEDK
jgi:hypothetical protein